MGALRGLLLLLLLPGISGIAVGKPKSRPVISLAISAKPTLKAGSPVVIGVTLRNISRHDIVFGREIRGKDDRIDVRDSTGKLAPDTKLGLLYNGHVVVETGQVNPQDMNLNWVTIPVKAGKTWGWGVDVSQFYDMSRPGKYSIFIQRLDPIDPSLPGIKSNVISVTILP